MSYFHHLVTSKGPFHLISRFGMIYSRFGFTNASFYETIRTISRITGKYGCKPTLFITADLLDHNRSLIRNASRQGIEVGLHGHHHVDHARMQDETQRSEISLGLRKLKECGIQVSGFRAPFLRFNEGTVKAVIDSGLSWVSNTAILFDVDSHSLGRGKKNHTNQLLESFYTCKSHGEQPSVPYRTTHCLEIPVSLPDDEILIDRFGIREQRQLTEIWLSMFKKTREDGELFNFLFHPERLKFVAGPLDALLREAGNHSDVWINSLGGIAHWWQQRSRCKFEFLGNHRNVYKFLVDAPPDVAVVLEKPGEGMEFVTQENDRTITLQCNHKPVIGLGTGISDDFHSCLINEGFATEAYNDREDYACVLDGTCAERRSNLLRTVRQSRGPLLRFHRWPKRFRSALAVTGDVDAITLWDFIRRIYFFRDVTK